MMVKSSEHQVGQSPGIHRNPDCLMRSSYSVFDFVYLTPLLTKCK